MRKGSITILAVSVLLLSVGQSIWSQQLNTVPDTRYARLTRGVNMSEWFWLVGNQDPLNHFQNYISDSEIRQLTCVGIQSIRLPIDINYLFDFNQPDHLLEQYLPILDQSIQRFIDQNVAVIVVPFGDFVPKIEQEGRINEAVTFWTLFAQHLSRFDPEMLFMEVANEPVGPIDQWQTQQELLIRAMRSGAPNHTLIATAPLSYGTDENQVDQLHAMSLMRPVTDPNVIYSVHFYEPYIFTQQGATWDGAGWFGLVSGIPYPSSLDNTADIAVRLAQQIDDPNYQWVPQLVLDYGRTQWQAGTIRDELMLPINWARQYGVKLIVDEFGVYREGGVDEGSRSRWLSDVRNILEAEGVGWTMWDYDGGFALMNGDAGQRTFDAPTANSLGLNIANASC